MPSYTFRNKNNDEIFEVLMKISDYDQYIIDNPDFERYHGEMPPIIDSVRLGIKKPPADFQKYVLGRIKENTPGHKMNYSRWDTPKEF